MSPPLWLYLTTVNIATGVYTLMNRIHHGLLQWKLQRHRLYARKYGQRRANQLIPLQPEEYPFHDSPRPDKEMGLGDPEFYADTWPAMLKVALGLYQIDADLMKYAGRWQYFKWAVLGFLLDWEVIEMRGVTLNGEEGPESADDLPD